MRRLADVVAIEHRNVRSVNIERELESTSPLTGFIPTEQVLDGVRRLVALCRAEAGARAWSITGPYGAGKSSFAHFVCALLAAEGDPAHVEARKLLSKGDRALARELGKTRSRLEVRERGFIRAVATAQREPVATTIVRALYRGAEAYWSGRRGRRPNVLHDLHDEMIALEGGDASDPLFILDALEDLIEVAPVMVVLDELGKALEFAADRSRESDLYLLQQVAERFSTSEQMDGVVIALQHLAFEDYATGLSAARRHEWRKIQGRFEDVAFAGGASHAAGLVGGSLKVGSLPGTVKTAAKKATRELLASAPELGPMLAAFGSPPAGYPLHPTVVPALVELAGRYGQHDRSLMAFLTSDAPDALPAFLHSHDVAEPATFVRLADVYDYFVEGAAALAIMGEDAARLREIRGRVSESTGLNESESACVKTVGVLNLVGTGSYRASPEIVRQAVAGPDVTDEQSQSLARALEQLQASGLLTYRDFANEFRVWQGSDFDVAGAIAERREHLNQDAVLHGPPIQHINGAYPARPVVARRHSQRVELLRYFESRYTADLGSESLVCERPDADGLLVYLLGSESLPSDLPAQTDDGRPLIVLASRHAADITEAAIDAAAAQAVLETTKELEDDVVARREIRHRAALAQAALGDRIEAAFDPTRPGVTCFARGAVVPIARERQFSELLSQLCDETYHRSPVVRTEMLNRRELTSQGAKTRRELLERMFSAEGEVALGITGYGPDRAMYESVLFSTGLYAERDGGLRFGTPRGDAGLMPAWEGIEGFLDSAVEGPLQISELYGLLTAPPYGMKEGPVPVLLAAALLYRADDVFVFEDGSFLPRLGPEHFERLVKTPERFTVKRAAVLGVRADVFRGLQELLGTASTSLPRTVRNATTLAVVRLRRPPEIGPPRMRVLPAHDNGPEEDRRREATTPYPRAGHPQAARGRADARRGFRGPRGGQGPRGLRADLPPLASPVWGDEGRRRQAAQGARGRERAPQADRRRQGARGRRPARAREGKLLSPSPRRRGVRALQERLGLSERRACQIAGQHRSTQRHEPARAPDDRALRERLREISRERPRWGYRRAHARLLEEGFSLNRKRCQRLWREEGLRVPKRRRKRQRLGESTVPAERLRAERPDQVWALDFQFDQTSDGRILKLLHVVDEFTREALAIECRRRIDADATVAVLDRLVAQRGTAPEHIRCDNGPELTANALRDWCRFSRAHSAYIEPGSPWQNPYVESFGSRVRDELLAGELFETLTEAQVMVADWRTDYNERRPHSSLGMKAPARFARSWREDRESGRPITLGDPGEAPRSPQDAPAPALEGRIDPKRAGEADLAAPAVPLRSPSGLAPRDGDGTTLQAPTDHRLSLAADR